MSTLFFLLSLMQLKCFPGGSVVKNLPAEQETQVLSLSWEDLQEKEDLQYSCLGNPMDRGDWRAMVHGVIRIGHDLATKPRPPCN